MAKENSIKIKREPTIWENTFANGTTDKGWISKIYKISHDSSLGKKIKNGQITWTDTSPRRTCKQSRDI